MGGRKFIISGYYGFSNAGDEAMLSAMIHSIKEADPAASITVISGHPEATARTFGTPAIHRFSPFALLRGILRSDIVISGGGSLLQDVTSRRSIYYYLSIMAAGILFRKKVFLYAQGIGPVRSLKTRRILKIVLDHVTAITVRDEFSHDFLKGLGVKTPVSVTADAVLSLPVVSKEKGREILRRAGVPEDRKIIALCVRKWGDSDALAASFRKYVEALSGTGMYSIVFIPMQCPDDVCMAEKIDSPELKNTYILRESYDIPTLMSIVGAADLLVGMRLHALIFSALMHIPMIGISYDPKIDHFLHSIERDSLFSIYEFQCEKLYNTSIRLLQDIQDPPVWKKVDEMREKSRKTISVLKTLMDR
jgi:polysaccharide pyruvyl transferase CsaB